MKNQYILVVKLDNQIKIAQYGKEDGNPAFAGMDILDFLKGNSIETFKRRVRPLGILPQAEENMAREQDWPIYTMGAQILREVMASRINKVILEPSFIKSIFCDWAYTLDLDTQKFLVSVGANAVYSLKQLPSMDKFLRDCNDAYDVY